MGMRSVFSLPALCVGFCLVAMPALTLAGGPTPQTAIPLEEPAHSAQALAKAPKIDFVETSFTFDPVMEGDYVIYDFVFTNTGKSDLVISQVKTG